MWIGVEGDQECSEPVAHDILEGIHLKQVCQRDSKKQQPGKASSVSPVVGVRLQVHRKF